MLARRLAQAAGKGSGEGALLAPAATVSGQQLPSVSIHGQPLPSHAAAATPLASAAGMRSGNTLQLQAATAKLMDSQNSVKGLQHNEADPVGLLEPDDDDDSF